MRRRRMASGDGFFMSSSLVTVGRARLLLGLVLAHALEGRGRRLDVELLLVGEAPLDREAREEDEAWPGLEPAHELHERLQPHLANLDVDVVLDVAPARGRRRALARLGDLDLL